MAATIWKGVIEFGNVKVPVRFHSAVQDHAIHFNLLHKKDHVRVKQMMVDPETGEPVPNEEIRRGFQVDENTFVIAEKEEIEQLHSQESRSIQVECFVPNEQINHQWYERPYYLGPDEDAGEYAALVKALGDNELEGVAHWVMRTRSYIGSLQASDGHLLMVTLRHADEVIPVSSLPRPEGRKLDANELKLAEQLVGALHTDFNHSAFHDEYEERVMAFIRAKAKGHAPKLRLMRPHKAKEQDNLAAVLTRSMEALRKERKIA
jgi:DNA end-binding protein Ku